MRETGFIWLFLKKGQCSSLDEPTNDLDVETLRALEEGLLTFPGSAIVVSHDRWFLDRICTHILAFEGNSQIKFHDGNYSDYELELKIVAGILFSQPGLNIKIELKSSSSLRREIRDFKSSFDTGCSVFCQCGRIFYV